MKKIVVFVFSFLITLGLVGPVFAQNDLAKNNKVVGVDQTIDGDYFVTGEVITISGTVNGDVYALGEKLIVDGTINGDILAAAGDVVVRGNVTDDVRVAGGQVTVSGEIGKSLSVLAGNALLTNTAKIGGSVTGGAGSVQISAPVGREVRMGAGDVLVDSYIGRGVMIGAGAITLGSMASVNGDFTYWSDNKADVQSGAQVFGKTTHNITANANKNQNKLLGGGIFLKVLGFLFTFLIGAAFIKFLPNFTNKVSNIISQKPLRTAGVGALTLIILPITIVLAVITIVGIPIAIILLFALFISIYISKVFIVIALGKYTLNLLKHKGSEYLALFAGLVIYSFMTLVPNVNILLVIVTVLIGVGSLVTVKKQIYSELRDKKIL